MTIDLNCDLAEGSGIEAQILPYISSANIACGFHAGSPSEMHQTALLCKEYGVKIGAHPSFFDREHFGRRTLNLSSEEVYTLVLYQVGSLAGILKPLKLELNHVKPHGALYNLAANHEPTATAIAQAVKDFNSELKLYALAGSEALHIAQNLGLSTVAEGFIDRTYTARGTLTPRTEPDALHHSTQAALQQALDLARGQVTAQDGTVLNLKVDTLCLHGDGEHALSFAKAVSAYLLEHGIQTRAGL